MHTVCILHIVKTLVFKKKKKKKKKENSRELYGDMNSILLFTCYAHL